MDWFIFYCIVISSLFGYGLYDQRKRDIGRWTTKDLKDEWKRINKQK